MLLRQTTKSVHVSVYILVVGINSVVVLMKMGNIVLRAGLDSNPQPSDSMIFEHGRWVLYSFGHPVYVIAAY